MAKSNNKLVIGALLGVVTVIILGVITVFVFPNITITFQGEDDPPEPPPVIDGNDPSLLEVPVEDVLANFPDAENFTDNPSENPITSNDTVAEQIIDEIVSASSITLDSFILLTDSNGESTQSITNHEIPALSFFVEDISNKDFQNGFIETRLDLNTDPFADVTGSGMIQILIGDQPVVDTIELEIGTKADEDGVLPVLFKPPVGMASSSFVFGIKNHIDKFAENGTTPVKYVITITVESGDKSFMLDNFVYYQLDITRDPNLIIIENESGKLIRVFPTDDRFQFTHGGDYWTDRGQCRAYYIRAIGTATLYDSENNIIAQKTGGSPNWCVSGIKLIDEMITRNETYRFTMNQDDLGYKNGNTDVTFTTPKSQKNYRYGCHFHSDGQGLVCRFPTEDGGVDTRSVIRP